MKNKTLAVWLGSFVLLSLTASDVIAQPREWVKGKITYKSRELIYVNLGTEDGLKSGDTLFVKRKGKKLGSAVVVQAALHSASAKPRSQADFKRWKLGDEVRFQRLAIAQPKVVLAPRKPETKAPTKPAPKPLVKPVPTPAYVAKVVEAPGARRLRSRLFGRLSFQYVGLWATDTLLQPHYDQPSIYGNFHWENIRGSAYAADLFFRHRSRVYADRSESATRVYTAALYRRPAGAPLWLGVGRLFHPLLGGVGTVDGVAFQYDWNQWQTGAIIGWVPVYDSLALDTKSFKWGVVAARRHGDSYRTTTLGFINEYRQGGLDRQFIYAGWSAAPWRWLNLNFSTELDLDPRDQTATRGVLDLSSLYFSARVHSSRWFTWALRYSYRKNVKYLVTQQTTPDSLFDNALRQGFYNFFYFRLPNHSVLGIRVNINTGTLSRRLYLGGINYRYPRLPFFRGPFVADLNVLSNLFVNALRSSMRASWLLGRKLEADLRYSMYGYAYRGQTDFHFRQTPAVDLFWNFTRSLSASTTVDWQIENGSTITSVFADLSYRFR